jgi:outer membrane protein
MIRSTVTTMVTLALGLVTPGVSQTLGLEQTIREVCANSDSVKMMNETIVKADEMVREKWANALPVISATGVAMHSYGSAFGGSSGGGSSSSRAMAKSTAAPTATDPVTWGDVPTIAKQIGEGMADQFTGLSDPQHSNIYNAGISFNQPIYTFGKVGTAIDVAKNFNKAAKSSYARNMQTLQLSALDLFFTTMMLQKAIGIAERSQARKTELRNFLERNFESGAGSKAYVLKTRADVADQVAKTIVAKRDATVMRMNLNVMMGRELTDSTMLDTVNLLNEMVGMALPQPADAVAKALADRSDIKTIGYYAESNKGGAKIFKSMYLPSIAAMGSAGYSRMDSDSKLMSNDGTPSWTLGIAAQWMLFDGFASSAKAAQYASDSRKLEIAASTVSKMVEIEIRSAILECAAADTNLSSSQEMLKAATETYELTNSNFKQGSGQFADLELADETLQQAELGLINARYRQIRSRAALLVAQGKNIVTINQEKK